MQRLGLRARPQQMVNFGIGGSPSPPFILDLSRWLKFDPTTLSVVDQIGDETRTLQPDRCITGDGVTTITFPALVDSVKWYDEVGTETTASISGAWTIPTADIVQIDEYDGAVLVGSLICESGNDLTLLDITGNGNHATLSAATVWNTTLRSTKNWVNRYGYNLNGTTVIPARASGGVDALGNALTYSGIAKMNAAVLGGKVALLGGANKITIPTFSKTLNEVFEISGYTKPLSNITYFAIYGQRLTATISRFISQIANTTYLFTITISNTQNVGTGTSIPLFLLNQINYWRIKSLGNGNLEITVNSTTVTRTYNITDRIIIDDFGYSGSLGASVVAHYGYNYNLNNESIYSLNNAYNSITGIAATNNGVTFAIVNDFTPQSTIDWLKYGGYILSDGSKIPNPQFPLPVGAIQVLPKGYNKPDGGKIDFNTTDATSIGESAFRFFDASDTDVWDGSAEWAAEYDPLTPYVWNEVMLDPDFILAHVNEAWKGFVYQLISGGALTEIIAYVTARTEAQESSKLTKYEPKYFS